MSDAPKNNVEAHFQMLDNANYFQRRRLLKQHEPESPRFLYKFRQSENDDDANRLREIVIGSELWLSSAGSFNDPFDMRVKFLYDAAPDELHRRLRHFVQKQGVKSDEIESHVTRITALIEDGNWDRIQQKAVNKVGVCSFAGDPRSILMWSHYGANHRGLCLLFEIANDPRIFLQASPVRYTVKYPVVNWIKSFNNAAILRMVLTKHKGWKYEQERRIVKLRSANTRLKFQPAALRAMIAGCRATPDTFAKLKKLLSERNATGMPPITIYQCFQDASRYELRIHRAPGF